MEVQQKLNMAMENLQETELEYLMAKEQLLQEIQEEKKKCQSQRLAMKTLEKEVEAYNQKIYQANLN